MDRDALYSGDYYAWLQQQVAMLRCLAQDRRGLPEGLDLEQIAEEVEDIGKGELRATRGFIRSIFVHVLLAAFDLDTSKRRRWSLEVRILHAGLRKFATRRAWGRPSTWTNYGVTRSNSPMPNWKNT
jgi:hypothetical protein